MDLTSILGYCKLQEIPRQMVMNYIKRTIEGEITDRLFKSKAVLVYGPRQCGKTTLVRHITESIKDSVWLTGDNPAHINALTNITLEGWRNIIGTGNLIVIDEAQQIPGIGRSMKLAIDAFPGKQFIATGSSSFDLANKAAEPLTGRKFEFRLLPMSYRELCNGKPAAESEHLETRLRFGSYPEIVLNPDDAPRRLAELAGSYLYRDLFSLDSIKKPSIFSKLVRALAFQIGNEISINELSALIGADNKTIDKYLDLLEKSFVLFRLHAFSANGRNEIRKSSKIYFWDTGIRNAVLGNMLPLSARTDTGALWENYLVVERLKKNMNEPFPPRSFYWRDRQQHEVDYIEETASGISAWEFKWNPSKKTGHPPRAFSALYPRAAFASFSQDNYSSFII